MARMLRAARRRAGLSQRELAERAGVPQSTVARIEAGLADARVGTLRRLLRVCGEDLEVLPIPGRGSDVSLIREQLEKTPRERLEEAAHASRAMSRLLESTRRGRG